MIGNYRVEVSIFGKMRHRIPFLLALRASVRRFQMPLKRLNFVTFGIITQQTHYKIRVRSFASVDSPSIFYTINRRPCLNYVGQFFEISIVYHTLHL